MSRIIDINDRLGSHQDFPDQDVPTVVVPVAGAFNIGPSGAIHFRALRHAIESQGIPVSRTIVPKALGLIGCMDSLYEKFEEDVEDAVFEHGVHARPLFVAHSLGGLPALRSHVLRGSAGVVTLGSPHGHLRDLPLLPRQLRRFEPYTRRCEDFEDFSQETIDILQGSGDTEHLTFVGSTIDEIVPVSASVPAVPGVKRLLIGPKIIPQGYEDIEHLPAGLVEHARLLTHRTAVDYIVSNVVSIADPLRGMPAPDNVTYVDFAHRGVTA